MKSIEIDLGHCGTRKV